MTLRYKQLRIELTRLRNHFLPREWDDTGTYSERKLDRARAYRILAHAEIEYYIENIVLDIVEDKYNEWLQAKKPSYVILCLVAASKIGWEDIESEDGIIEIEPIKIKREDESIHQMIERSIKQYREIVKNNNGVKTRDIKRLIMPLGLALSDLDQTFINNLNSFGGQRGFIAHTSRLGVKNIPDPKSEKESIDLLLRGLKEFDELIAQLNNNL